MLPVAKYPNKEHKMQLLGIPLHERIPDEQPSCLVRGPAIQKARERIGFDIGNWHQMEWYINLVRLDFENVSDGDFQNMYTRPAEREKEPTVQDRWDSFSFHSSSQVVAVFLGKVFGRRPHTH